MSLGSALQIAQNSLLNVTRQTNVVSRNITDASNEDYVHRRGVVESNDFGSRVVVNRNRADNQLVSSSLQASADAEAQGLIASRLEQLNLSLNGIDGSRSPATLLTRLHDSIQVYSANPSNTLLGVAVVQEAGSLSASLNDASALLQNFRVSTDVEIGQEVAKLNEQLAEFHQANIDVVDGTRLARDVNDALDRRDAALREITKIVPVNVLTRENSDSVLITKGGATLFEGIPRNVTFEPNSAYIPTTPGNEVRIDGVPVLGGQGGNTDAGGSLAALVQLRDSSTTTLQNQLDEIARGLVSAFAEVDRSGAGLPAQTGLLSYSGSPTLPVAGATIPGLASEIRVNTAYDPTQGGDASLLRDGGFNGAAYVENPTGGSSFADRLITLAQGLDGEQSFDPSAQLGTSTSLLNFAGQASGWLDGQRSDASHALTSKEALRDRLQEKISNQTGVNIDEEMAVLLQLERSYEASARLIATVDEMLQTLLATVR